ncbi:MAG: heparinase II/III family protein [Bacteroidota bacterium]
MKKLLAFALVCFLSSWLTIQAQPKRIHPSLSITPQEVELIRNNLGKYPLFDAAFTEAQQRIDAAISQPIDVPVPVDAGGYTHEKHKQNYNEMYLAGILFQVTKDEKYAQFIRAMLIQYAKLYPTLKNHPAGTSATVGRLFWQTLNETVWLVHTSQAYDCIYDWLQPADRKLFETNIFRPMAKFFIEDHIKEFDRIHNHGTWTLTAVGMIGYVMGDQDLVDKALYGSKKTREFGYFRQLDLLFSPDGFYSEGPYYVRYAMMPFFLFAQAVDNNQPELKVFEYRDQILKKAFYSAMQLTYTNGAFFPINDALKEKTYLSPEVVIGLDITYFRYGMDANLLGIAKRQNEVMLNGAGLSVAKALNDIRDPSPFPYASVEYRDGAGGDEGGVGVLRSGDVRDQSVLVMKYTAHGMEHGHYDKLAFLYYDQGREIIQDYGAARFINVEPKFGGRYLPETKSWTRQTIAHNTVTVDGKSDFNSNYAAAEAHHSDRHFFSSSDPDLQYMSAKELNAYPDVAMQRTMLMVRDKQFSKPVVIDIFTIKSPTEHQYDFPFYYLGTFLETNVAYTAHSTEKKILGTANGYEHLWVDADGRAPGPVRFTWMNGSRYYSLITAADSSTKVFFTQIGGSDPNFNLRNEPGFMLRQRAASHVFASVLEPHGEWDGTKEFSIGARPTIRSVIVLGSTDEGTVVEVQGENKLRWIICVANGAPSGGAEHSVAVNGTTYRWKGNIELKKMSGITK